RRSARLGDDARRTLTVAAVAGRRVELELLRDLRGADEPDLVAQIKELVAAGLLIEESADRFAFRHALTREAVLAELLTWERQMLHQQIATALERRSPDARGQSLDDLAFHTHAAGRWEEAFDYCRRAGERARTLDAPRAAAEHFSRAIEAGQRLGRPPDPALLRGRGLAYETLGDFDRARADHEATLAIAETGDDRRAAWQALLDLGFLWTGRTYVEAGAYFQRALDLAREIGDPPLVAQSLNRVGNWHANVELPVEGQRLHREALANFEALGDRQGIAETLDLLGMATGLTGDLASAWEHYRRAAALFREFDNRRGLAAVLTAMSWRPASMAMLSAAPPVHAPPGEPTPEGLEALKLTREIGWRAGEAFVLMWEGLNLACEGAYGPALTTTRASLVIAEEIGHRQWAVAAHLGLGMLHDLLMARAVARQHLTVAHQLAHEIGSLYWIRVVTAVLASIAARQREITWAATTLAALPSSENAIPTAAEHMVWYAKAELALASGDPSGALAIVDRLVSSTSGALARPGPLLGLVRGEALAALGRSADAGAVLRAAHDDAIRYGARPLLWRIDVALGRLHQGMGKRDGANQAFAAARATIEALAAEAPDDTLRERFLRAAAAYLPAGSRLMARRQGEPAGDGLTEREREVAALLTQGLSNREIAEALFISELTVATHVRNSLSKLGFTSRTQIAAWALERGLKAP
ncbi:MAG: helix-turn-helix transcriptional regulator, partial [Thermomicrobiales bacterium]